MRYRRLLPLSVRSYLKHGVSGWQARKDPFGIGLESFVEYLPSAPVIVEAGAHVGSDTQAMARRWRAATIHAFEPVPELFELLRTNVMELACVRCHHSHSAQ